MIRSALAALIAMTPLAAHAQVTAFDGIWCANETIYVDAYGIGFNDHTMCDFLGDGPDVTPTAYSATIQCRNVNVVGTNDDGTAQVNEMPVPGPIEMVLTRTDVNHVMLSLTGPDRTDETPLPIYERCD